MTIEELSNFTFLNDVCRHELKNAMRKNGMAFLNDVCRHELVMTEYISKRTFLNDVCRHEPSSVPRSPAGNFLNGVCRHELMTHQNQICFILGLTHKSKKIMHYSPENSITISGFLSCSRI